jgi:hypothetical protein
MGFCAGTNVTSPQRTHSSKLNRIRSVILKEKDGYEAACQWYLEKNTPIPLIQPNKSLKVGDSFN